jgi:DNA-binding NtrC family response regulator
MAQTVLIAEDEATIRTVVAISLQEEYSVLPVSDADEALSVARSHVNIALLLTDVQMCGGSMNGIELAERMLEERPRTKVLVMSGCPGSLTLAAKKGYPCLEKPFTLSMLAERVHEVLAAKIRVQTETTPRQRKVAG